MHAQGRGAAQGMCALAWQAAAGSRIKGAAGRACTRKRTQVQGAAPARCAAGSAGRAAGSAGRARLRGVAGAPAQHVADAADRGLVGEHQVLVRVGVEQVRGAEPQASSAAWLYTIVCQHLMCGGPAHSARSVHGCSTRCPARTYAMMRSSA